MSTCNLIGLAFTCGASGELFAVWVEGAACDTVLMPRVSGQTLWIVVIAIETRKLQVLPVVEVDMLVVAYAHKVLSVSRVAHCSYRHSVISE